MQKILIVDDSEINREILAAMLEKTYEIDMAKDGQEAIEILEKKWETYQIVLLDLNMPVINGYEVLKVMEEKQWLDSLPVIGRNIGGKYRKGVRTRSHGLFYEAV